MPLVNGRLKDALLKVTKALPNGANTTTTDALDTGVGSRGDQPGNVELLLTVPDLTLTQLPNTKTMTFSILCSDSADLSNPTVIAPSVVIQTGVTGTDPLPGVTFRFRMPREGKRYWGAKCVGVATADCSASSYTLEMVF